VDRVSTLIAQHFSDSEDQLAIGGLPIGRIVSEFGTPLFVYSTDVLARTLTRLRQTYPAEFAISYSVKANPNRAIVGYFLAQGCGLEVASAGELSLALAAGCPPQRIMFAGPGKTEAELRLALTRRIGEIHIESMTEAGRLSSLAEGLGEPARIALRVNPSADARGGAMQMGGKPAPFGVDEELLEETLDQLDRDPNLAVRGIHLFSATQILDHTILVRQYEKGLALARRAAKHLQRPLRTLDFGGGLGVPYFAGESELDMDSLKARLRELVDEVRSDKVLADTQLVIEPGRYLVAEAGLYVARINDIKVSRGKTFLIIDGGMNHHLAASGNLGQVIKRNFPMAILNKIGRERAGRVDVVGPLCTPLDTLARDVPLPAAEIGDLLGIFCSGAYGLTASPVHFLSHPLPAEVLVEAGVPRVIRRRREVQEDLDDLG
jgi:diaminopimelate decarboxylase